MLLLPASFTCFTLITLSKLPGTDFQMSPTILFASSGLFKFEVLHQLARILNGYEGKCLYILTSLRVSISVEYKDIATSPVLSAQ